MGHYRDLIDAEDDRREAEFKKRYDEYLTSFASNLQDEKILKELIKDIVSLRDSCNNGSEMVATRNQFARLDKLFETIKGWNPPRRF